MGVRPPGNEARQNGGHQSSGHTLQALRDAFPPGALGRRLGALGGHVRHHGVRVQPGQLGQARGSGVVGCVLHRLPTLNSLVGGADHSGKAVVRRQALAGPYG